MADLKHWSRGEISRMRKDMDRWFDDLCTDFDLPVMFCRVSGDLELHEEGNTLVARLELGSTNPDDVTVSVVERSLIIAAKSVSHSGKHKKTHTFRKEIRLPCMVQEKDVIAEFKDGVLVVSLPKCTKQTGQTVLITKK